MLHESGCQNENKAVHKKKNHNKKKTGKKDKGVIALKSNDDSIKMKSFNNVPFNYDDTSVNLCHMKTNSEDDNTARPANSKITSPTVAKHIRFHKSPLGHAKNMPALDVSGNSEQPQKNGHKEISLKNVVGSENKNKIYSESIISSRIIKNQILQKLTIKKQHCHDTSGNRKKNRSQHFASVKRSIVSDNGTENANTPLKKIKLSEHPLVEMDASLCVTNNDDSPTEKEIHQPANKINTCYSNKIFRKMIKNALKSNTIVENGQCILSS